jgi:hypothetical protein
MGQQHRDSHHAGYRNQKLYKTGLYAQRDAPDARAERAAVYSD